MITSILTSHINRSVMMKELRHYLTNDLKIIVVDNITTKNSYGKLWREAQDLITWGVKWSSPQYKRGGRNVLFCENGQLNQKYLYVDNVGYFSHSSIVEHKEYFVEPNKSEVDNLKSHILKLYGHKFGRFSFNPDGPILVPLQMNRDATMRHYFPGGKKNSDRVKAHIQYCIDNIPKGETVIIRCHPREKGFPEGIKLPNNFHIDNSGSIKDRLKECKAVVAVNSTVVTEALIYGLPVATLGNNIFTGANVTLNCANDPTRIKRILKYRPKIKDIKKYFCAVLRRQLPYNSPIEETLKNPSIQEWLQVVMENRHKRPLNFDMGNGLPKPKNKCKIVMIAGKHEETPRKRRKPDIRMIKINYDYDITVISASRAGKKYLGSIIANHPQIDETRVGILDIQDDEVEAVLNNKKCQNILLYKEDLFENYISHYIWERWGSDKPTNQKFSLDEFTCMRWIVATREKFNKYQGKALLSIPFSNLDDQKINDLFNMLEVSGLLTMSPNTQKCGITNKQELIRNYDEIKNQVMAKVGLSIWSKESAGNNDLTHCGNCHNETIDRASKLNRCLHCGIRN